MCAAILPSLEHPAGTERLCYSPAETLAHINRNLITRRNARPGRKCGDGRSEEMRMESILGGDLGYVFTTQAALREMDTDVISGNEVEVLENILDSIAGNGPVYVHTDRHHGNEDTLFNGCGANGVARGNMEGFGLQSADFEALDMVMANRKGVHQEIYEGNHAEGAVVFIQDDDFGIRANDTLNNSSIFVISEGQIKNRLLSFSKSLASKYGLNEKTLSESMYKNWKNQTIIIAARLAHLEDGSPLPVYNARNGHNGIDIN